MLLPGVRGLECLTIILPQEEAQWVDTSVHTKGRNKAVASILLDFIDEFVHLKGHPTLWEMLV